MLLILLFWLIDCVARSLLLPYPLHVFGSSCGPANQRVLHQARVVVSRGGLLCYVKEGCYQPSVHVFSKDSNPGPSVLRRRNRAEGPRDAARSRRSTHARPNQAPTAAPAGWDPRTQE